MLENQTNLTGSPMPSPSTSLRVRLLDELAQLQRCAEARGLGEWATRNGPPQVPSCRELQEAIDRITEKLRKTKP